MSRSTWCNGLAAVLRCVGELGGTLWGGGKIQSGWGGREDVEGAGEASDRTTRWRACTTNMQS